MQCQSQLRELSHLAYVWALKFQVSTSVLIELFDLSDSGLVLWYETRVVVVNTLLKKYV